MKLKNHDSYMQRLELYAEAQQIAVEWRDTKKDFGIWMPQARKIVLNEALSDSMEVAVFLHELGHTQDDALISANTPEFREIEWAYRRVYGKRVPKRAREIVREREKHAWFLGRGIAKRLRIPLGRWFERAEVEGMEFYIDP